MLGLAEAATRQGLLDEAADLIGRALTTSDHQPITPVMARAHEVTAELRANGYGCSSIDDRLSEFAARLAPAQPRGELR